MSDGILSQVEQSLRNGKPEVAIQAARAYADSADSGREAGIAIARSAAGVYRDLIAPPVEAFAEMAPSYLPEEVGGIVQKALQRLFRMTEEWEAKLWDVHTERLTRELREWVRMRHLKPAAANVARLMALVPEENRARRANFIGMILGTVINNQKEARELLSLISRNPSEHFLTSDQIHVIDAARQKRHGELGQGDLESLERQWSDTQTRTAMEIRGLLPANEQMDDPDEATLRDFGDTIRSILRVPIILEEPDLFLDATHLLQEFIPKEQSQTSRMVRLEGRIYNNLGVAAKKTVMLVFHDIGKNSFFTEIFKNWADSYKQTDDLKDIVEVMGAFRSQNFHEFFQSIQSDRRLSQKVEQEISAAYGAVAGEEAIDELESQLRGILSRKRMETADLRAAERHVAGLCNIAKSPRTSTDDRRKIREFLRTHVPEDITSLAVFSALQGFNFKSEELTPQQRQWAVRVLVRGLWMPDETTIHHRGDAAGSEIGFRQEIVEALTKMAPADMETLMRAMEPLTGRYGTAFLAAAELLDRLKDPQTLPLLERLLNNTLMHDASSSNIYQQEYYWDITTNERRPLTKEKVIEPLIHAIGAIGAAESKTVLQRYRDMVATGKVAQPTGNTAVYLERFLGNAAFDNTAATEEGGASSAAHPADVDDLIKQVSKRYLLSGKATRRMKKIEALTKLAQLTPLEALETVFDQLSDKDTMVVSAAITCLAEYASPNKAKAVRDLTINTCLETFEHKDPAMRQGAVKLLRQIGPNRKDVKDKVLAFAKATDRREAREALADALRSGGGAPPPSEAMEALGEKQKAPENIAAIEARREYLAARQAWIASGKKGDPPPKPPGME